MDFEALQAARESCRVYSDRPVPREALAHLEYLMEAGQVAREAGPEGSARYVPRGK